MAGAGEGPAAEAHGVRLLLALVMDRHHQAHPSRTLHGGTERTGREVSLLVERAIGQISRNCRLARNFEPHCRIAAAFARMAMIRIMLQRLAAKPSA